MRGKTYFRHKSHKFRVQAEIKHLTITRVMFLFRLTYTPHSFLRKEMISNNLTYSCVTLMHSYSKDWQNSEIPFGVWCYIISLCNRMHRDVLRDCNYHLHYICNRNFTEQHCHHLTFIDCMIHESRRRCAAETVSNKTNQ